MPDCRAAALQPCRSVQGNVSDAIHRSRLDLGERAIEKRRSHGLSWTTTYRQCATESRLTVTIDEPASSLHIGQATAVAIRKLCSKRPAAAETGSTSTAGESHSQTGVGRVA